MLRLRWALRAGVNATGRVTERIREMGPSWRLAPGGAASMGFMRRAARYGAGEGSGVAGGGVGGWVGKTSGGGAGMGVPGRG